MANISRFHFCMRPTMPHRAEKGQRQRKWKIYNVILCCLSLFLSLFRLKLHLNWIGHLFVFSRLNEVIEEKRNERTVSNANHHNQQNGCAHRTCDTSWVLLTNHFKLWHIMMVNMNKWQAFKCIRKCSCCIRVPASTGFSFFASGNEESARERERVRKKCEWKYFHQNQMSLCWISIYRAEKSPKNDWTRRNQIKMKIKKLLHRNRVCIAIRAMKVRYTHAK